MEPTELWIKKLRKAAIDKGIKLPKGAKDSDDEVAEAFKSAGMVTAGMEMATGGIDDKRAVEEETLKILEAKFGLKQKKATTGKATAGAKLAAGATAAEKVAAGKRKAEAKPAAAETKTTPGKGTKDAKTAAAAASVLEEVWDVSSKEERRECLAKLIDIAIANGIRLPEDEDAVRMGAGTAIMGCKEDGKVKVKDLVESLVDKYGRDPAWVDPDDSAPKKKKKPSTAKPCICPENKAMAAAFDELAGLYFKEGSKAGHVYKKVVSAIKDLPEPMLTAPKGGQIPGIGAKTIQKIAEFLETGKIQLLEDKRAEATA